VKDPYGFTQVSDQARHAVLLSLSPRLSSTTAPGAWSPFTVILACLAGVKQL
jgi:hypothetical protein